jgi:RNA polymerase sigma-70 factor (ECF subfamily)
VRTHYREPEGSDRGNVVMFEKSVGLDLQNGPREHTQSQRIEAESTSATGSMACAGRKMAPGSGVAITKQNAGEAAMIASILAGDAQLYHELIRPHERSVYMMALSFVKNEADAEDISQEAFLKAFCNLSAFRAESKFSTWLISITLNEARSWLRRRAIVRMESLDVPPDDGGVVSPALLRDWREIPSEAVGRLEVRQMLQEAVTGLPLSYRVVFQLRDVTELSIQETAEALGISVPCVKVRLHRARIMLLKQLSPLLKRVNSSPKGMCLPWL